jgi:hypothetical protein
LGIWLLTLSLSLHGRDTIQQFHQYQQNEQPPLASSSGTQERPRKMAL